MRSLCYSFPELSRFDVKQKAGNIIAAIATTNAIIAGLIVVEALKLVEGDTDACRFTYLYKEPNQAGRLLNSVKLEPKNPNCYVCSQNFVSLQVTPAFTLGDLTTEVLRGHFGLASPNVMFGDSLLYEAPLSPDEEDEMAGQLKKTLAEVRVTSGCALDASDNVATFFTLHLSVTVVERLSRFSPEQNEDIEIRWRLGSDEAARGASGIEPPEKRLKQ